MSEAQPKAEPELRLRADALSWREIDGELVAIDVVTSTYLSANPAGTMLWQMLAAGTHRDELVESLIHRFGIPRNRAATDVNAFLEGLQQRGLLAA